MCVVRCVLLTHSAATSQRHAPAPRQRCTFPQNEQPQRQQGDQCMSTQKTNTKRRHTKEGEGFGETDHEAKGIGFRFPTPPLAKWTAYSNPLPRLFPHSSSPPTPIVPLSSPQHVFVTSKRFGFQRSRFMFDLLYSNFSCWLCPTRACVVEVALMDAPLPTPTSDHCQTQWPVTITVV